MTGELSTARELVAAVVLAMQVGSVGVVAGVATARLVGQDRLVRALTWVLLVLAQAVGVPLVLGMIGLLSLPSVVVAHLVLAAGAVVVHHRRPIVAPRPLVARWTWSPLDLVALAASTVYVTLGVHLSLHPQRSFEFDTKEYHLSNLASWLQDGHIWSLPYAQPGSFTATHPGSGEMLGLWLALPSHGDELVYVAPVAFGILAILAGAVLGRELTGDRSGVGLGALATVAVLTAPIYFAQVESLLTDLIASASIVTAVALLLASRRASPSAPLVALAGIALGLGVGSKYTVLLPGLAVALAAVVLLRRSRSWWWLVPGVLVLAAPWYVRNIAATGNPLFPQAIGPIDGGNTPIALVDASLVDHLLDGETGILRQTASLAREFIGPLLAIVALGIGASVVQWVRGRDRLAVAWVGGLAAVSFVLYVATPYTGGGPTGLNFIIASCFRYVMIGMLLAAVAGAALASRWLGGALVALVLVWNAWQIAEDTSAERYQLDVTARHLALAIAAAVVAVVVVRWSETLRTRVSRVPLGAVVAGVLVGSVAVGGALYHRLDRSRTPTLLETTLLELGADRPAVLVGVADLRAVLGPRLERPLVKVSRGGAADEIPFADDAQMRRRVLGDQTTSPPPPGLGRELDRAIEATGASVLVVGGISPVGYPDGWLPAEGWCLAGGDAEGTVFVRPELLPPDTPCVSAADL